MEFPHCDITPGLIVNSDKHVRSQESSGRLEEALELLTDALKQIEDLRQELSKKQFAWADPPRQDLMTTLNKSELDEC